VFFFLISYFVGYEHYDLCNVLFGFTHFEITILNELICSVNLKNFGKIIRYLFNGYDSIIICIM
jgi:hypothetical protein